MAVKCLIHDALEVADPILGEAFYRDWNPTYALYCSGPDVPSDSVLNKKDPTAWRHIPRT